jgi:hypothetical protein
MSKLAFRAHTVDIAYLPLRQDFLAKNVLMTAQRDFRLGNSPHVFDHCKIRWNFFEISPFKNSHDLLSNVNDYSLWFMRPLLNDTEFFKK